MCYIVDNHLITEYEDTFIGLGCLPGKYHIEFDENVTPVQHAPKKVPISLKNKLEAHLEAIEASNVITPQKNRPSGLVAWLLYVNQENCVFVLTLKIYIKQ